MAWISLPEGPTICTAKRRLLIVASPFSVTGSTFQEFKKAHPAGKKAHPGKAHSTA